MEVAGLKIENAELRADVKFLMDQNSVLVENLASKPIEPSSTETHHLKLAVIDSQQSIIPAVSTLMTNFNELFKMTRNKIGNEMGKDDLL